MLDLDKLKGKTLLVKINGKKRELKEPSLKAVLLLQKLETTEDDVEAFEIMEKVLLTLGLKSEDIELLTASQLQALLNEVKNTFL